MIAGVLGDTAVVTCLRGQRIYLVPLGQKTATVRATESVRWRAGKPVEALTGRYGRLRTAVDDDRVLRLTIRHR